MTAGDAGQGGASAPLLLVTRPQAQADDWVAALQALGVAARALPLLEIAAAPDPLPVRQAWAGLSQQALVVFVSPSAVQQFFALAPPGAAWPDAVLAGSPGAGTAAALRAQGVPAPCLVSPDPAQDSFDSEALWARLQPRRNWAGARCLVVRGEQGRNWLADRLRGAGAQVQALQAYSRQPPRLDAAGRALLADALARPQSHGWLFSSSEAVNHLPGLAPAGPWAQARALATHARIAQAARAIGFGQVDLVAPSPEAVARAWRAGSG